MGYDGMIEMDTPYHEASRSRDRLSELLRSRRIRRRIQRRVGMDMGVVIGGVGLDRHSRVSMLSKALL